MNDAIGGYFELELNDFGSIYHDDLIALNSGRNALEFILIQKGYRKIYIPYYTCEVTLQPLKRQNIEYEFYFLDKDFYPKNVVLEEKEALLYVNYYGIMNIQIKNLSAKYSNLIVDNSQAFYERPIENVDTFYSPRKFFGVPDGGFASCQTNSPITLDRDISSYRMTHLLTRIDEGPEIGYEQFINNETKLDNLSIRMMSRLTRLLLLNIDFKVIEKIRLANFVELHLMLKKKNELSQLIDNSIFNAPMIYPYLKKGNDAISNELQKHKIYTAKYWPNVKDWLGDRRGWEYYMFENLIALPVDQRYNIGDLEILVKHIL